MIFPVHSNNTIMDLVNCVSKVMPHHNPHRALLSQANVINEQYGNMDFVYDYFCAR